MKVVPMVTPRSRLIQADVPCCYHLTSRCSAGRYMNAERREWMEASVFQHAETLAMEVLACVATDRDLHVVVRVRPDLAQEWTAEHIASSWLAFSPQRDSYGMPVLLDEDGQKQFTEDDDWLIERRKRLSSTSWLMRLVKQKGARRANSEDGAHGVFWEERFVSLILDNDEEIEKCIQHIEACAAHCDDDAPAEMTSLAHEDLVHVLVNTTKENPDLRSQHILRQLHIPEKKWMEAIQEFLRQRSV